MHEGNTLSRFPNAAGHLCPDDANAVTIIPNCPPTTNARPLNLDKVANILKAAIGQPPGTPPGCVDLLLGCVHALSFDGALARRRLVDTARSVMYTRGFFWRRQRLRLRAGTHMSEITNIIFRVAQDLLSRSNPDAVVAAINNLRRLPGAKYIRLKMTMVAMSVLAL
jgi:hypothetical protein